MLKFNRACQAIIAPSAQFQFNNTKNTIFKEMVQLLQITNKQPSRTSHSRILKEYDQEPFLVFKPLKTRDGL